MSTHFTTRSSTYRLRGVVLAAALASTASAPGLLADTGKVAASDVQYVWEVDMRGKPPYERKRVALPLVDVASIEVDSQYTGETVTIWEREHSGRPPFKRERIEVPVVDAASMEVSDEPASEPVFRGRPPFKRHR
jgi:hypothetical protein